MGCPGKTLETVLPFFNMKLPFTITYSIPSENASPFSKVALSKIVLGSKMVISASAPTCIRPLKRIIGAIISSRWAGSKVIFLLHQPDQSLFLVLHIFPRFLKKFLQCVDVPILHKAFRRKQSKHPAH